MLIYILCLRNNKYILGLSFKMSYVHYKQPITYYGVKIYNHIYKISFQVSCNERVILSVFQ